MLVCVCVQVLWAEQQVVKKRKKRDLFEDPTDPDFPKQWYLVGNVLLSLQPNFFSLISSKKRILISKWHSVMRSKWHILESV